MDIDDKKATIRDDAFKESFQLAQKYAFPIETSEI